MNLFLIVITCIVSYISFSNENLRNKLILYPVVMRSPMEAYRLITSGFVHADTMHLAFNMITLYFFGDFMARYLGAQYFIMLYLSGIVVANIPSYYKNYNNPKFASLGASGGVAAVIFAYIFIMPWQNICLFFALCFPAIFFAIGYLIYSYLMSKKQKQEINHDAHFIGSVYGFVFMIILDPTHGLSFWNQISHPVLKFFN
ncbi:MAG TPA: rhomboid family intramembrane serine protease [Edaphocola sp.]|nr:rhomboid family intramembrane serine protease [Edaphocola sp.]